MSLFEELGFHWDQASIAPSSSNSVARTMFRYQQSMPQFVFDASSLEGNPFTYPEVKTLMDGVTVGGHRLSDLQQVKNLADAANLLLSLVKDSSFSLSKVISDRLHFEVAKEEALEWGHFRGEGDEHQATWPVQIGEQGSYWPLRTEKGAANLKKLFRNGVQVLQNEVCDLRERALAYFLLGALTQFYFDGNKRTARFMMNGILMSNGLDAISIPATRAKEFNEKMVRFYVSKDGTEMMHFLIDCEPKDYQDP